MCLNKFCKTWNMRSFEKKHARACKWPTRLARASCTLAHRVSLVRRLADPVCANSEWWAPLQSMYRARKNNLYQTERNETTRTRYPPFLYYATFTSIFFFNFLINNSMRQSSHHPTPLQIFNTSQGFDIRGPLSGKIKTLRNSYQSSLNLVSFVTLHLSNLQ